MVPTQAFHDDLGIVCVLVFDNNNNVTHWEILGNSLEKKNTDMLYNV